MEASTENLITLPKYGTILASEITDYSVPDQLSICSQVLGLQHSELAKILNRTDLQLTGWLTQTRRGRPPHSLRQLSEVTMFLLQLTGSVEYSQLYFNQPLEPKSLHPVSFRSLFIQGETKKAMQYIQELSV